MTGLLIAILVEILAPCQSETSWYERGHDDQWFYQCGDADGNPL